MFTEKLVVLGPRQPFTIGRRVNHAQLAKLDAAARLLDQPRAHFIVSASLAKADEVLRIAANDAAGRTSGTDTEATTS